MRKLIAALLAGATFFAGSANAITPFQWRIIIHHNVASAFYMPGSPYAVFSTRKVVSGYAGKAVNVRRASDNTTADIGFVGNDFDAASFNTFCAGQQGCFVTEWYDQSGNGRNISQSNDNNQPGVLVVGNKAYVAFGVLSGSELDAASTFTSTGNITVGLGGVVAGGDISSAIVSSFDDTNGYILSDNGITLSEPNKMTLWEQTGGEAVASTNLLTQQNTLQFTRASGALTMYVNGVNVGSATGTASSNPSSVTAIGNLQGGGDYAFQGLAGEIYFYSSAITTAQTAAITGSEGSYFSDLGFGTPYSGASSVHFVGTESAQLSGTNMQYEYTQPWTMFAAVQCWGVGNDNIVFTNVPASSSTYPGYEVWYNHTGQIVVAEIHSIAGGQEMQVVTNSSFVDGKKHFIAASYDGSGVGAGVHIYVDGVAQTTTTEMDTLGGLSIVSSGQTMTIGNQNGQVFPFLGSLGHVQIDNVVRSSGYIASYSTPSSLPPVDANTALSLAFTENTGTTANDASTNGYNATLSTATMWVP